MRELDIVVLTRELPEHGLAPGDTGTVVHCHEGGAAYEVEFMRPDGTTIAVVTLENTEVRPAEAHEVNR